mgnify:CR=1 FL=1
MRYNVAPMSRGPMAMTVRIELVPIGVVRSPYKERSEAPRQGWLRPDVLCEVVVFEPYTRALKDVETFSHIIIIYYCHKARPWHPLITTPWDTKPHGLFATRSPDRPNPLGLCVAKLVERRGNILVVRGLDALDGSPVLDIKPYLPAVDAFPDASMGWLKGRLDLSVHQAYKMRGVNMAGDVRRRAEPEGVQGREGVC